MGLQGTIIGATWNQSSIVILSRLNLLTLSLIEAENTRGNRRAKKVREIFLFPFVLLFITNGS